MRVTVRDFFYGLNVNSMHYLKKFKQIGVQSSFIFLEDDLIRIRDYYPVKRYRSLKVVERAAQILEGSYSPLGAWGTPVER